MRQKGAMSSLTYLFAACLASALYAAKAVLLDAGKETVMPVPPPLGLAAPFPPVWPTPSEFSNGTLTLALCAGFRIIPPAPSSPELEHMIARYRKLIRARPGRGARLDRALCSGEELAGLVLVVQQPSAALGSRWVVHHNRSLARPGRASDYHVAAGILPCTGTLRGVGGGMGSRWAGEGARKLSE